MNKNLIIVLLVAVLVIAGGAAAYLFTQDSSDDASSNNKDTSASITEGIGDIAGTSISKLLGANIARKCTYTDSESTGTIYLTGDNRMRSDYQSTTGEYSDGSIIVLSDRQYLWEHDTKEGIIMNYDRTAGDDEDLDDIMNNDDEQSVDLDKEYDFKCSTWLTDESLFTPPADVNFADMSAFMLQ